MSMLSNKQKNKYSSLRVEIIDLTMLASFYVNKFNNLNSLLKTSTRYKFMEELISLRYMENGLILHLVNLDDDSSDYSFRKVIKEINKTSITREKQIFLKKILKKYRQNLNYLKVNHRNKRIAHLSYVTDLNIDEFLNYNIKIKPLIETANEIGDLLWGEKIEYKFKLGSLEDILNFREKFENLKIEI